MKLSEQLRAARALISEPGTWGQGSQAAFRNGIMTHCALGAIYEVTKRATSTAPEQALYSILEKRFVNGTLVPAKYAGSMSQAIPWKSVFDRGHAQLAISQFNNSTSQAGVLALFDEAIADAKRDEQPELPLEIVNLLNTLPVKELADA